MTGTGQDNADRKQPFDERSRLNPKPYLPELRTESEKQVGCDVCTRYSAGKLRLSAEAEFFRKLRW